MMYICNFVIMYIVYNRINSYMLYIYILRVERLYLRPYGLFTITPCGP